MSINNGKMKVMEIKSNMADTSSQVQTWRTPTTIASTHVYGTVLTHTRNNTAQNRRGGAGERWARGRCLGNKCSNGSVRKFSDINTSVKFAINTCLA